jgi:hypothetical protein
MLVTDGGRLSMLPRQPRNLKVAPTHWTLKAKLMYNNAPSFLGTMLKYLYKNTPLNELITITLVPSPQLSCKAYKKQSSENIK